MIDAVAFDLDGTLIESELRWAAARREVTEAGGGIWREDAQPSMMGLSTPEWIAYMQRELGVRMDAGRILAGVVDRVGGSYRRDLPLIDGAYDAVRRLEERWPLALASSSPRQLIELVLELAGLEDAFEVVVSAEEVARGKPSPDVYLWTCQLLRTAPPSTAAVEDSGPGVLSAVAAGMPAVMIPGTEYPPAPGVVAEADLVLESIRELSAEALEGLTTRPG